LHVYIIEAKYKAWDCFDSFVVVAKDVAEAIEVFENNLEYEYKKWSMERNFDEGYTVETVNLHKARVIHSDFRSG
jgi:hypothetical protein